MASWPAEGVPLLDGYVLSGGDFLPTTRGLVFLPTTRGLDFLKLWNFALKALLKVYFDHL